MFVSFLVLLIAECESVLGTNCDSDHDIRSVLTISFCDFADRSYGRDGGVFNAIISEQLVLDHCAFLSCIANNYGGAVFCRVERSNFISQCFASFCNFTECQAYYGGGGFYWCSNASGALSLLNMSTCLFNSCIAGYDAGGGLYCGNGAGGGSGTMEVINCEFDNCCGHPNANGGGIHCLTFRDWTMTIHGSSFWNCSSVKGGSVDCLNVNSNTPTLGIYNSSFINGRAGNGGALMSRIVVV